VHIFLLEKYFRELFHVDSSFIAARLRRRGGMFRHAPSFLAATFKRTALLKGCFHSELVIRTEVTSKKFLRNKEEKYESKQAIRWNEENQNQTSERRAMHLSIDDIEFCYCHREHSLWGTTAASMPPESE
jgi:hypothetical protein